MPAETGGTVRALSRAEQKQLIALACAADRLEWQLQVRRFHHVLPSRLRWLASAARAGLACLPRRGPNGARPAWRRAWFWIRTALELWM